jgi:hypothetical protein
MIAQLFENREGDRSDLPERSVGRRHACMVVAQIGPVPFLF